MNEELWSYAHAARVVGCSRQRIAQLVADGRLSSVRSEGRWYVRGGSVRGLMRHGLKRGRVFRAQVGAGSDRSKDRGEGER